MKNPLIQRDIHRAARLAVLGMALAAGLPALAQRTIAGPYLDLATTIPGTGWSDTAITQTVIQVEGHFSLSAYLDPISGVIVDTSGWAPNGPAPFTPCGTNPWSPFTFCINWTINDGVNVTPWQMSANPTDIPVKGLSYFSYDLSDRTGNVLVTTLYGQDVLNGSRLRMTAFDPVGPAVAFSNEQIVGKSGKVFTPTLSATVSLGDLGAVLGSGYDISSIDGDPHGQLYLFQTNVTLNEISSAVPEPATYLALASGLALLSLLRRRQP